MARSLFIINTVTNIIAGLCFFIHHVTVESGAGFTVDLIRRDHLKKALAGPAVKNVSGPPSFEILVSQSRVFPDNGEYVMKLGLGTPPVDIYAILDTGSDLFWVQCLPCDPCFPQKNPKFDPKASSTYRTVQCPSSQCHLLDSVYCSAPPATPNLCSYRYGYADGSVTQGFVSTETVTLTSSTGQPVSLPNIVFGCGHNNSGVFNENEMGLIGLGKGRFSFISQIGTTFGARRFSHCLVPLHTDPTVSSKMSFGDGSEVTGPGVVSTPMVNNYAVTLNGISVGDKSLPFNSSGPASQGNMIMDSGTPTTTVPTEFYNRLVSEVRSQVKLSPIDDPQLGPQLCYDAAVQTEGPILTAHLDGNADLKLTQKSIFIETKPGIFCFRMAPTDDTGGIYGNFAQTDYLIGFDIDKSIISFKQTDCTKQQ